MYLLKKKTGHGFYSTVNRRKSYALFFEYAPFAFVYLYACYCRYTLDNVWMMLKDIFLVKLTLVEMSFHSSSLC